MLEEWNIILATSEELCLFNRKCKSTEEFDENGHLEYLQYLNENGCTFDETAPKLAVKNGHLNCLKYIYSKC